MTLGAVFAAGFFLRDQGGERLGAPYGRNSTCGCGGMVDALVSGTSGGNPMEVQVLSSAPKQNAQAGSGRFALAGIYSSPRRPIKILPALQVSL